MNKAQARQFVKERLDGVTDPVKRLRAVNECITELREKYNFIVLCPISGAPLLGVSVSPANLGMQTLIYHVPGVRATV